MVANLTAPDALLQPFASNGDKNTIPLAATGTQAASLDEGFPPITSTSILEGGIPPQRTDFNGLGYLLSSQFFYLQNGGNFTFNQAVSDAIGGYPQGAILNWEDTSTGAVHRVKSLIPNNIYNFVTTPSYVDGEKWEIVFREIPSQTGNAGKVLSTNGTTLSWEENITGAATTIKSDDLTASKALISNTSGKVAVSAVTSTELGYLSGVTSAIQTQLNGKQASGSYVTTDTAQTVSAIKTFSAIPKVSATIGSTDNSTNVPTTAWTRSLITSIMNTNSIRFPKYNTGVGIAAPTSSAKYTCPYDLLYVACIQNSGSNAFLELYVDNYASGIGFHNSDSYAPLKDSVTAFLKKGQVIYWSGTVKTAFVSRVFQLN